jgi:hypothetical protein
MTTTGSKTLYSKIFSLFLKRIKRKKSPEAADRLRETPTTLWGLEGWAKLARAARFMAGTAAAMLATVVQRVAAALVMACFGRVIASAAI